MNSNLARFIFEQGARLRNPSLFEQYELLKTTEFASQKELENLQLENARKFLRLAETHSPYYKKLFQKIGFKSDSIGSLDDLKVIPEISKETLISDNAAIHTQGLSEQCRIAETSGTSGAALSFNRNERWDSLNRATMMRSYDWYGVKPWDRNGYLWGYNISKKQSVKTKFLDSLQNRFRLFNYSSDEIALFAEKLSRADFLTGYSSMIYEVSKMINQNGFEKPKLKMVKGTSETILDIYQKESIEAFGAKIVSEYGAAESGLIAFECPHGNMHINTENLILETNSQGDAIVTNFASTSFPVIRYNLKDSVTLSEELCDCGRAHPILKDVSGRKGSKVIGKNNTYPALTFYYIFKNIALEQGILINYKAIQSEYGKVTLDIEKKVNKKYEESIKNELKKYFGDDVDFNLNYVEQFKIDNRKRQYFESSIV
ncbi:phenylacetate--CoA ligase family protein [Marinobacter nauticus]|uniref:phenylacetate--CoA ligase family protein n=1 Tax=Marinobacter nauticus TaxID=2743 RepID=UPI001CD3CFF4|nr:hypothetical protein [Marinobacter nauticus]MCA0911872.1 hypothetical protein [Marinobacter nauticus]